MDNEFDKFLIDMKPYVMKLNHKSEKQRCALWIKKLCEKKCLPVELGANAYQVKRTSAPTILCPPNASLFTPSLQEFT